MLDPNQVVGPVLGSAVKRADDLCKSGQTEEGNQLVYRSFIKE
jgi:hypothetical protein